jgi:hypothetical protein
MQIDFKSEQSAKDDSSRSEILQPSSNVTTESAEHSLKQPMQIFSVDDPMQIDRSKQSRNADSPRILTLFPTSNSRNDKSVQQKQPDSIRSMSLGILTSPIVPRYRTAELPSTFVRKSPKALIEQLVGSTKTSLIGEFASHRPPNVGCNAGIRIHRSDKHPGNANPSIFTCWQLLSNERTERHMHAMKQYLQMVSVHAGMHMDVSDPQYAKHDSPKQESVDPRSNITVESVEHE